MDLHMLKEFLYESNSLCIGQDERQSGQSKLLYDKAQRGDRHRAKKHCTFSRRPSYDTSCCRIIKSDFVAE